MSWRPGELWLETELLWFRERAGVPALAGFAPPALRLPAPPAGSSPRASAGRPGSRRRYARRARATAIVLSPALLLAAGRAASAAAVTGTRWTSEDPPSLTFSLDHREDRDARQARSPARATQRQSERPARRAAPGDERGASIGRSRAPTVPGDRVASRDRRSACRTAGSLVDGTQLPGRRARTGSRGTRSRTACRTRRSGCTATSTRSARSSRCSKAYRAANPDAPRVVVGDISLKGGGPMRTSTTRTRTGSTSTSTTRGSTAADARRSRRPDRPPARPGSSRPLRRRRSADGVRRLLDRPPRPGRCRIPYANHENHMHVRFPPPA